MQKCTPSKPFTPQFVSLVTVFHHGDGNHKMVVSLKARRNRKLGGVEIWDGNKLGGGVEYIYIKELIAVFRPKSESESIPNPHMGKAFGRRGCRQ